jgi:hypothetical protein
MDKRVVRRKEDVPMLDGQPIDPTMGTGLAGCVREPNESINVSSEPSHREPAYVMRARPRRYENQSCI